MKSSAAAEARSVEKSAKTRPPKRTPAKASARKPASPRKRTAAPPKPAAEPAPPPVAARPGARFRARARATVIVLASATAALALFLAPHLNRSADEASTAAAAVSAQELVSFAGAHGSPVFWAGDLSFRTIELTRTEAGVFVRYLPADVEAGTSVRALTVATYPMRDAYATAARRAKGAGMTSRPTRNDGLAVWSTAQPTSVYVAFRGVPALVEVYAPVATDARTLALSGRVRPVG